MDGFAVIGRLGRVAVGGGKRRSRSLALFLSGLLIGTSVGLASGAIPSPTGVFTACYDASGALRT